MRSSGPRRVLVVLATGLLISACGDDGGSPDTDASTTTADEFADPFASTDPQGNLELSGFGACGEADFYADDSLNRTAVSVTLDASGRSTTETTRISFTVPDEDVEVKILRGYDLHQALCTDPSDSGARVESTTDAVAGEGEISLDPAVSPPSTGCGETEGTLELRGLEAEDGTTFATIEFTSAGIGCDGR